jgi:hypothetical protein
MKVRVETTYSGCISSYVELPEGKTWDDVEDFYVKWHVLNVKFKDGDWQELAELEEPLSDDIDYKRPDTVSVYADGTHIHEQVLLADR